MNILEKIEMCFMIYFFIRAYVYRGMIDLKQKITKGSSQSLKWL